MNIIELLTLAKQYKASDVHLSSNLPPAFRINGDICHLDVPALTAPVIKSLLDQLMGDDLQELFRKQMELDFAYEVPAIARVRVNVFCHTRGFGATLRLIPEQVLTLEEIAAPEIFRTIASFKHGLVLVTGATGSGKSTTLAAMLDFVNSNYQQHILTIEDPVEFVHKSKKSLINQRELTTHTHSFANALKSALREDPDCILVGEMRDLETIRLALTAAETGHLVFASLHTASAPKTIDRIIDVFPVGEKEMVRVMLSESLKAVISQTLIKKQDNSGRIAAYEIMLVTAAVRNLIRENKIPQLNTVIQTGQQSGMQTMEQAVAKLVKAGVISS